MICGDAEDESDGMGIMKSSFRWVEESVVGCIITETCSRIVSGKVLDTLN